MFSFLYEIFSNIFLFILHVTNTGSFPAALSSKEERELLIKKEKGDENSRQKLIEHNLRLVAHIVKKYHNTSCDPDDLISIGTIGLIKAVSTFKNSKGIRLSTYAARCIENEILMYFRNMKKTAGDVYINDPIDTDKEGNALTLMDVISDESNILEDIDKKIKIEHLKKSINSALTTRERSIISMRYGLNNREELTQREVASILGISRSYVSRIEKAALEKLKSTFPDE